MEEGGHPSEKHMDDFFKSIGLQRKKIAKDGSCLFRAVAEQVLLCQSLHTQVRARCVEFLKDNRELYKEFIEGDFDDYLSKIQDPQDWVGEVEINALAIIYKRDFLIFQEPGKPAVKITENGFKHQVQLCFLNGNHYDSVYPISHIQNTALCQSLLYELLYEGVFGEDPSVLGSGLRGGGRSSELTDDHMTACPSSDESETEDPKWIDNGAPKLGGQQNRGRGRGWRGRGRGLSERLRRSLNPNLLRNVDYDVWLTSKRVQQKMDFCMAAGMQYSKGDRCQVCLDGSGRSYSGSINKVSPSNGPVSVYIEELGKLVSVPLLNLRPVSDSSWTTVVSGEKRTNGHTSEWVEPKGRGRGKPLPSASLPSFSKAAQRGSPGHVQKQTSWPPNITADTQVQRGSRGRSATCEDVQMTSEDSREEEEAELRAALVEIQLRDEQNFPALAAVPRGSGGKRRGGEGMSKLKSGATTGQADAALPGTAASTSPSSSPPTHPEHPGPAPTTWLASLKAPLLSQNTTFTSAPRPPGTVAPPSTTPTTTTAPTAEQSLPSSSSPSSSSTPIFIAPVAPPPGGTHFHLPRTSPAPSSSCSAPPARSSPLSSSPVSSPLPERPAQDVMNTARHMQLPAAYVSNTPVPQNLIPSNPVPQTSLPQNPTPPPSVSQNPLLQSSVPQNLVHSNPIPQHPAPEPSMPQHPVPEPSVPQHPKPQPSVPQHPVPEPPVPQHPVAQPIIPHQPVPEPSMPQHPVAQSSVPQHPVAQPSVPQHPVPEPSVPQYPVAQSTLTQHPVDQPSVPQYPAAQSTLTQHPVDQPSVPQYPAAQSTLTQHPVDQPSVPQHPVAQPSLPQHPVPEPSVPQYPETQTPVPQHPVPEPPVPQHHVAQPSVPQQSLPQYPQLQTSSPVPGLLSASQASAESPPNPSSHPLALSLPPNPLPPQHTFNPSSRPEPSQAAVPLQQLSQLYQDPLYPGFPMGPTGDMLPTPAYSSSRTGDDLPRDMNVLRWFFNLGVKGYCNPMFPPYMYLLPLQQSHTMHPPPRDPSPQGLHPSPPLLWQQTAPPPPTHPLGYPSTGPGPRYPGTPSPGLQLYPSDRLRPPPDASPGPGPRHPKLEGYGAGGANRAHAAPDAMLANVGVGKPAAGVLVDPGHRGPGRQVLLIDPPLNNTPIWVAEPKCQDSVTATTHSNCGARSLYSPAGNTPSSDPHSVHYLSYPPYNNQIINPAEAYVHMGAGPSAGVGMEPWKGPEFGPPEFGPSNQRSRRGYQHQRGGGGEQRGRGYRRGSRPQYPHSVAHRTRDQVYY